MEFPLTCLRGLRNSKWVKESGVIEAAAFLPEEATAAKREDGGSETSINYEDDDRTVDRTLSDKVNAKYGAVRLPLSAIDYASLIWGNLSLSLNHERCPIHGNDYHGNIVYAPALGKRKQAILASILAESSKVVGK